MEGRNSLGRRVSLLNDIPTVTKSTGGSAHSNTSYFLTLRPGPGLARTTNSYYSPSSSPPTPHLMRSDSSDSTMNRSPSPVTPSFIDFNGLQPTNAKQDGVYPPQPTGFFNPIDPSYPQITQPAANFYPAAPQPIAPLVHSHSTQGPASTNDPAGTSSKGPAKQQTKKNSYPCPLAKQFNCQDHFTTSGHAARHAKKHTGKKDAFCPECNKAFTRKDNMEQHRRTHQNGRNATKSGGESAPKRQRTGKRTSTATSSASADNAVAASVMPLQTSMPAPSSMLDPSLAHSPASSFGFPDNAFAAGLNMMQQYPDPTMQFGAFQPQSPTMVLDPALAGQVPNGMANGLDTLAMAAAKRDDHF